MKQKLVALFLITVMALSACGAVGLTAATKVDAAAATTTTLTISNNYPKIGEKVTFTAKLTRSGTKAALVGKPLTIYHYVNSVRYNDRTNVKTDSAGKVVASVTFNSPGVRTYYATFGGDSTYAKSTSAAVTVEVTMSIGGTRTTLRLDVLKQTPKPNQAQIVIVRLSSGTNVIGDKTVNLFARNLASSTKTYLGSVTTYKADGAAGKSIKLPAGNYYVYATFDGSGGTTPYAPSTSQLVLCKVATTLPAKKPTNLFIWTGAPHQKTTVGTWFVLDAGFYTSLNPVSNKPLTIAYMYKAPPSTLWNTPKRITTIGSDGGWPMYLWKAPAKGSYLFFFVFSGDSHYYASQSNFVEVIVS